MRRASILRAMDTLVLRVLGLSPTTQKIGRSIRSKSNVLSQGASARRSSPFFVSRVSYINLAGAGHLSSAQKNRRHASTPGDRGKFLIHYTVERDRTRRGETAGLRSSHIDDWASAGRSKSTKFGDARLPEGDFGRSATIPRDQRQTD
jgi:hypothetical protein